VETHERSGCNWEKELRGRGGHITKAFAVNNVELDQKDSEGVVTTREEKGIYKKKKKAVGEQEKGSAQKPKAPGKRSKAEANPKPWENKDREEEVQQSDFGKAEHEGRKNDGRNGA